MPDDKNLKDKYEEHSNKEKLNLTVSEFEQFKQSVGELPTYTDRNIDWIGHYQYAKGLSKYNLTKLYYVILMILERVERDNLWFEHHMQDYYLCIWTLKQRNKKIPDEYPWGDTYKDTSKVSTIGQFFIEALNKHKKDLERIATDTQVEKAKQTSIKWRS